MYECSFCNVNVPANQLIAHSRTKRHKILCKQEGGDYFSYVISTCFKNRLITYKVNGSSKILDPLVFLLRAASKVEKIIELEIKEHKHIIVNIELFCTYLKIINDEDILRDLKSFNTKNVTLDSVSNLC